MWHNSPIDRLGNPVEAEKSEHPEPIVERASSKLQVTASPVLYAATKPKARSTMGFLLSGRKSTPQGGLANGPCLGRTHIQMRLLASRRENLQAVSQEQSRTVIWRLAPRRWALWKLKPDLMGAVV